LLAAMSSGDQRTAQACSSYLAWRKDGGDLQALFETAHTTGLGFVVEVPKVSGDRAAVTFGFEISGKRQGEATLYLEKRGAGWLATGYGNDTSHTQAFLRGEIAATVWPRSAFDTYRLFVEALEKNQPVRMAALADPTWWSTDSTEWLAPLRKRDKPKPQPKSVRVEGLRAIAEVQWNKSTPPRWCHFRLTAEGWRLVGHSTDAKAAESWLVNEAEAGETGTATPAIR
ncbi:MAG: hypothetical protein R3F17_04960, partial [Planctomycetota bacterium]